MLQHRAPYKQHRRVRGVPKGFLRKSFPAYTGCGAADDKIRKHRDNDKIRYCNVVHTMKKMMLFLLMILWIGCKDEGTLPPSYQRTIDLALEDYGTTDVWLRVRFTDAPPHSFRLMRDGQVVVTVTSSPSDTLIADEPLLPNRSYTYKAYRLGGTSMVDSSLPVHVTTLDTTSSAWQWALDTLGVMNSYLLDCAIIAPDNIWVVGQIYVDDIRYNAATWNGVGWELKRIPFIGPCSAVDYPPIVGIWALSASNILVTNGGAIVRYDGTNAVLDCGMNALLTGALNKIYANSPQDVYAVGGAGTIVKFNGSTWQRQESGTGLFLSDVWGRSATEVYATGNQRAFARGVVLKSNGQSWQSMIVSESSDTTGLFRTRLYGAMEGLWVDERRTVYTVGNLMYEFKHSRWDYVRSLPGNYYSGSPNYVYRGYLEDVQGNASNDIFICGQINTLRHFNGVRWVEIGIPYYPLNYGLFWYTVAMKGNTAAAVGSIIGRGIVIRMWR